MAALLFTAKSASWLSNYNSIFCLLLLTVYASAEANPCNFGTRYSCICDRSLRHSESTLSDSRPCIDLVRRPLAVVSLQLSFPALKDDVANRNYARPKEAQIKEAIARQVSSYCLSGAHNCLRVLLGVSANRVLFLSYQTSSPRLINIDFIIITGKPPGDKKLPLWENDILSSDIIYEALSHGKSKLISGTTRQLVTVTQLELADRSMLGLSRTTVIGGACVGAYLFVVYLLAGIKAIRDRRAILKRNKERRLRKENNAANGGDRVRNYESTNNTKFSNSQLGFAPPPSCRVISSYSVNRSTPVRDQDTPDYVQTGESQELTSNRFNDFDESTQVELSLDDERDSTVPTLKDCFEVQFAGTKAESMLQTSISAPTSFKNIGHRSRKNIMVEVSEVVDKPAAEQKRSSNVVDVAAGTDGDFVIQSPSEKEELSVVRITPVTYSYDKLIGNSSSTASEETSDDDISFEKGSQQSLFLKSHESKYQPLSESIMSLQRMHEVPQ